MAAKVCSIPSICLCGPNGEAAYWKSPSACTLGTPRVVVRLTTPLTFRSGKSGCVLLFAFPFAAKPDALFGAVALCPPSMAVLRVLPCVLTRQEQKEIHKNKPNNTPLFSCFRLASFSSSSRVRAVRLLSNLLPTTQQITTPISSLWA